MKQNSFYSLIKRVSKRGLAFGIGSLLVLSNNPEIIYRIPKLQVPIPHLGFGGIADVLRSS